MFASDVVDTIAVPGDPAHTVTIQKLSRTQLRTAREVAQRKSMAGLRELGGAEFLKELQAIGGASAAASTAAEDPLVTHDETTVLNGGIKAWSYAKPVTPAAIDDLDEEAAEGIARAICALSIRKRTEEQEKNGGSGSTGISAEICR